MIFLKNLEKIMKKQSYNHILYIVVHNTSISYAHYTKYLYINERIHYTYVCSKNKITYLHIHMYMYIYLFARVSITDREKETCCWCFFTYCSTARRAVYPKAIFVIISFIISNGLVYSGFIHTYVIHKRSCVYIYTAIYVV